MADEAHSLPPALTFGMCSSSGHATAEYDAGMERVNEAVAYSAKVS